MRLALGLEYDGSRFCGWQSQAPGCGVQDALEAALSAVAGEPLRTIAAGRTDTGVHALYQVVHFDTTATRPGSAWVRGVNSGLREGVSVLWSHEVPDDFHARYAATERSYRYLLLNHPVRPGVQAGKVGWFHLPLDLERMRAGARHLLGEHDFSAFRAAECQAKSPVKQLRRLEITARGDLIVFDFAANAFLHRMVRNIVGCLVYVGKGEREPDWPRALLESRDRRLAAPTFSADGLYLSGVYYDQKWRLPAPGTRFFL